MSSMSEDRIIKNMVEQGRIGRPGKRRVEESDHLDPDRGLTRPTGSKADMDARNLAVRLMKEIGLEVKVDMVGNIIGRKEGERKTGAILVGSHVDSVVEGGMFDGDLGVFGAIEAVRRLIDEDFRNKRPIEVAVYTGEEGSAFNYGLLGSSVLTGKLSVEDAWKISNREGETLAKVLDRIGYKGDYFKDLSDVEYQLELHVEQGPVLENKSYEIGIVENITGLTWIHGEISGSQGHAGTTPMQMRKDSMVAASELVQYISDRAGEIGPTTVGTVGEIYAYPNRPNVIPGKVVFEADLRDVNNANMKQLQGDIMAKAREIQSRRGVTIDIETAFSHGATPLNAEVQSIIERAAGNLGYSKLRMNSGAGHDSQNMARKVKTGMIFVPSAGGVSHAPTEWTEWEDIERGVRVLAETIRSLASRPHDD